MKNTISALLLSPGLMLGATAAFADSTPATPPTGIPEDSRAWMEDMNNADALAWAKAETDRSTAVLQADPRYPALLAEATAIAESKDRVPGVSFRGDAVYNFWQDADHVQGLWRTTTLASFRRDKPDWQTVLDVDALAKAEGVKWVFKGTDCDEETRRHCVVHLSNGGEDAVTIREFDMKSRAFVPGGFTLPRGKQNVAWADTETLLVARDWGPGTMSGAGYPLVIKTLKRGQPLDQAQEVFRGQPSDMSVGAETMRDAQGHQATLITRNLSFFEVETYLLAGGQPKRLALPLKSRVHGIHEGQLIVEVKQDWTAGGTAVPQGAVVALDLAAATADPDHLHPVPVYTPTSREGLNGLDFTRHHLLISLTDNVKGRVYVADRNADGSWRRAQLQLPDNANITVTGTDRDHDRAFVTVAGFLEPLTLSLVDTNTGAVERLKSTPPQFDASKAVVEQREAVSSDGTHVPYFVVRPRDVPFDGSTPTLLYAYGGFEVPMLPRYLGATGKMWLERGGAYVLANIRGGGEFGPAWHEAGLKTKRQAIYDDFVAVARDLVATKLTSTRRLGIEGGSNGGLLMGVQFTQHPELWRAVVIQVPLLDMLRFPVIGAGASWMGEYGDPAVPEERAFLAGISPYHNLKAGVTYPEPLFVTSAKDDRVNPGHARKMAAKMKEMGLPYLYYENTEGGHAASANLKETARRQALEFTYLLRKLKD
ncbi:prolyl oligopeptidase family serine peptidase [Nitrospirillum viridazoti]|uniref:S9 family peptidase n=1 Tax=Nitrospirillum viridazoti CBAmc TaxID=1441467 RepID=A0A248JY08_9PROT|nr:prolyl oligopeptidase family serine peptidase [Nitrospirillum amazonense]ASG23430.1 S9 family peptidase [Nitrospirillum amazonense CBAmc]TWB39882.1 prolyl oligopeptidase [Nitrospirillum amazonense]